MKRPRYPTNSSSSLKGGKGLEPPLREGFVQTVHGHKTMRSFALYAVVFGQLVLFEGWMPLNKDGSQGTGRCSFALVPNALHQLKQSGFLGQSTTRSRRKSKRTSPKNSC